MVQGALVGDVLCGLVDSTAGEEEVEILSSGILCKGPEQNFLEELRRESLRCGHVEVVVRVVYSGSQAWSVSVLQNPGARQWWEERLTQTKEDV